jgi:N-acetylmuramoyl-L-alanine amidase
MDIGATEIRRWHTDPKPKGQGWNDIGYHFVVRRNGIVEDGRPVRLSGAHAAGHNTDSIGICLVGGVDADDKMKADCNFTSLQWDALFELVNSLTDEYRIAPGGVLGHRDLPGVTKACPCFDARAWWAPPPL